MAQEIIRPSASTTSGTGLFSNPSYAWDNTTSWCVLSATGSIGQFAQPRTKIGTFTTFGTKTETWTGFTISVLATARYIINSGYDGNVNIEYSVDGGVNWIALSNLSPMSNYYDGQDVSCSVGVSGNVTASNLRVRMTAWSDAGDVDFAGDNCGLNINEVYVTGDYTASAPPSITSVSTANIGETSTITGSNFNAYGTASSVTVNSNGTFIGVSFNVFSNTSITFTVPQMASTSPLSLTITTPAGTSSDFSFSINNPSIGTPSPSTVSLSAGTTRAYTATVTNVTPSTVSWSATGGSFSTNTWTSPASPSYDGAPYTITATAVGDTYLASTATAYVYLWPSLSAFSASTTSPLVGATVGMSWTWANGSLSARMGTTGYGSFDLVNTSGGSGTGLIAYTSAFTSSGQLMNVYAQIKNVPGNAQQNVITITAQTVSVYSLGGLPAYMSVSTSTGAGVYAYVSGAVNTDINWSATGGSFTPTTTASGNGTSYTAPATPSTYTITARSAQESSKTATATVQVVALPTVTNVAVSTTSPAYGATVTVTPTYTGSSARLGTSTGGTQISSSVSSGVGYTSGAITSATRFYCRAYNLASATTDGNSSLVTPLTVVVSAISPANPTVAPSAGQSFSATVSGASNTNINWTATGGSFSPTTTASGGTTTWTAPATPGNYTITATSASGSGTFTTTTATIAGAPTVTSVSTTSPAYGASWTITGTNFTGATNVKIGATSIFGNCVVNNSTTITVSGNIAQGTTGVVSVTTAGGTGAGSQTVTIQTVSVSAVTGTLNQTVSSAQTFGGGVVSGASNSAVTWSSSPVNGSWSGAQWTPTTTGTYSITATSQADGTKSSTLSNVNVVAVPVATSIIATKSTVTTGTGGTTLTPTFSNGTGKIGTSGVNSSDITASATSGLGVTTGQMTTTNTFTLTVTNAAGALNSTACTVTVVAAATASLGASTTTPSYNSTSVTITPTFTGAATAVVGTSQGASNISASPTSGVAIGVQTGGFVTTTTYWLRATNAAGDYVDSSILITAGVAMTVTNVSTTNPAYGATWTISGTNFSTITDVKIGATSIFGYCTVNSTSLITVAGNVPQGLTGVITVTSSINGPAVGSQTVTIQTVGITNYASTGYVTVNSTTGDSSLSATISGTSNTTVNWSASGPGGAGSFSAPSTTNGQSTTWTAPATPGSYSITATSQADGSKSAMVSRTCVHPPSISSFVASPAQLYIGGVCTLTPTYANASSASISPTIGAVASGSGYSTGSLRNSNTYTLTTANLAGTQVTSNVVIKVVPSSIKVINERP